MPTVAEILALPALALEPVAVPEPAAQARWVATSELADPSPYLEGGEILLTTGLVERDEAGWREYAARLREAGVVAVGFGVGLSHPVVPSSLQAAAAAVSLNLFIVPKPVPFIAVSRAVAELLTAAEREAERQALHHQQRLTAAAVEGPAALLAALSAITGGTAVLCGPDGGLIAGTPAPGLLDRVGPALRRLGSPRGSYTDIGAQSRLTVQPVGLESRLEGYLVVESAATAQRIAVTTAVALLSLHRERARAELEAARRIRAGAVTLALRAEPEAARSLLAGGPEPAVLPRSSAVVLRARGAKGALGSALTRLEAAGVLAAIDGEHLVAVTAPERQAGVIRMLDSLEVGIGPARAPAALAESDTAARQALAAATAARRIVAWTELAAEGVGGLLSSQALGAFAWQLLGPLTGRPELLEAVRTFLAHNGQVGPAAESLGVHRNTLRNRLAAAESALGRSLHDPQLRADLWVALRAFPHDAPHR